MMYARALAALVMFAAVHSLPAWAAVLVLAAALAAFAALVWWLFWRVMICRRGLVLSWFTAGITRRPARVGAW
jgi:hypothetical protein